MLKIYFSFIHQLPTAETVRKKLLNLPLNLQQKITAYKNPRDSVLQLSGKLLLQELIQQLGLSDEIGLHDLQLSKNSKPHFNNALYFSNAHSGQIAVCVACTEGDVGIDIEEIKPVDLANYEEYFTVEEWRLINTGDNTTDNFLSAWTRKEAILKASGSGVYENFASFEVLNNTVSFKKRDYYLQKIQVAEGYVCHIASTVRNLKTEIRAVELFDK